ncbi:sterile alpha motif-like domain-containing protein [Lactiplantibacillus plantarum]|uniref:sterile alpha motif-like domain-containing protein n=1 Tax=Lactiplantibacillus plantarum TaxID=1590 RepID=UPI0021A3C04F|nr:sterile alpha motif-like domain-containing protein [Lactiplantibacillus plantarum]
MSKNVGKPTFLRRHFPTFYNRHAHAHSDFDFPLTSNVHELSDYITYLNIRDSVKKSFYSALDAYQAS